MSAVKSFEADAARHPSFLRTRETIDVVCFSEEALRSVAMSVCRRLHLRPEDRDDFVQDACLRVLSRRYVIEAIFRGDSSPQTYLYRIIRNFGINWVRAQRKQHLLLRSLEDFHQLVPADRCVLTPEALYEVERHHVAMRRALRTVMSQLTTSEHGLLWSWALHGYHVEPQPGISLSGSNATYCRVSRALRKARALALSLGIDHSGKGDIPERSRVSVRGTDCHVA